MNNETRTVFSILSLRVGGGAPVAQWRKAELCNLKIKGLNTNTDTGRDVKAKSY
jgi:hypothetical protein